MNATNIVKCPMCGRRNEEKDTLECVKCQKDFLCIKHFDEIYDCCHKCAEKLESKKKNPTIEASSETTTKEWFYIHPEYKANLANRVSNTKVLYNYTFDSLYSFETIHSTDIIYDINGAELIRKGLAMNFRGRNDKYLICVDLLPLIVNVRWDDITNCLVQQKTFDINDPLFLFCVKKNKEAALEAISNSKCSLENVALLCIGLAEKEKARDMLNKYSTNKIYSLLSAAKLWFHLFNNKEKAKELVEKAENIEKNPSGWRWCAEIWKGIFNDTVRAQKCLEQAEYIVNFAWEWQICTEGWKGIFNDTVRTRKCIERIEIIAKESFDWQICTKCWKEIFDDTSRARYCLEIAENIAEDIFDWNNCAISWKELFYDMIRARKCLEEVERIANSFYDPYEPDDTYDYIYAWNLCAESWKEIFNDTTRARLCLEKSVDKAKDSDEWAACAEKWENILNDTTRASQCLSEAEYIAESCIDWVECAKKWKDICHDTIRAQQCLENAEIYAKSSFNWTLCSNVWEELNEPVRAEKCRKKAESLK